MPFGDVAEFMEQLSGQAGTGALALRFTILTAARTSETIGARWAEIDTDSATWTVPGERMKAGREHRVPLTDAAMAVLRTVQPAQPDPAGYVFARRTAGEGLSNMSLAVVMKRMGRGHLTVHGFRSTFRDWAAETTAHPRELAEAALAHTLRDKVEAAYRRGDLFDKRRALMAEWATFCGTESKPVQ